MTKGIEVKVLIGLICLVAVIAADQLSKYWVLNVFLADQAGVRFGEYFNVVRAWNTGVSFSMLNNYGKGGAIALSVLAIGIVAMLLYWLKSEKNKLIQAALGLIMGGALGNVIDRVFYGAVFDFLDFHIADSHWPAFNVADSCICIGATIIVLQAVVAQFKNKEK